MNPHQKNKVDINKLSADEQRLFRLYGKLPNRKDLLQNKLKERKYFDSGDYALSKAGKASDAGVTTIGREHPVPENIPHSSAASAAVAQTQAANGVAGGVGGTAHVGHMGHHHHHHHSGSPVKEGSYLQRETSADEIGGEEVEQNLEEGGAVGEVEKKSAAAT